MMVDCIYCDAVGSNARHRYWCPNGPDRAAETVDEVEEYIVFQLKEIQLTLWGDPLCERMMRRFICEFYMGLDIGGRFPRTQIDALYQKYKEVRINPGIVGSLPRIEKPKRGMSRAVFHDGNIIMGKHETLRNLVFLNTPEAIEWRGKNGLGALAAGWQLRSRGTIIKVRHIE